MRFLKRIFILLLILGVSACGVDESILNSANSENDFDVTKKKTDVPLQHPQSNLDGYWLTPCLSEQVYIGNQLYFEYNDNVIRYAFIEWEDEETCTGNHIWGSMESEGGGEGVMGLLGSYEIAELEGQHEDFLYLEMSGEGEVSGGSLLVYFESEHVHSVFFGYVERPDTWEDLKKDMAISEYLENPMTPAEGVFTFERTSSAIDTWE